MNIQAIEEAIKELEMDDTTVKNVQELATLYIVKEKLQDPATTVVTPCSTIVEEELKDILPQYRYYIDTKRKFQLNQVTENAVIADIKDLCREIGEFIHTLYSCTDIKKERILIESLITDLYTKYCTG